MTQLLTAPLIPAVCDQLWQDLPAGWQGPARLLLLSEPLNELAPARQMLHEIAQNACGLTPIDYRVLELPQDQILPWAKLKAVFQPDYILLFGLAPARLGIQARMAFNQPNRFGGALFVPTHPAAGMSQDKNLKKELWTNALKGLFQK